MADLWDNPMGTDGFEFVEYTGPDPQQLAALFERMGFVAAARHRSKNVTLYKQGDVNFILNAEPESFAQAFARLHGPSVCAIAFRVKDAAAAYDRAIRLGAKPVHGKVGPMELNIPAIEGIGGSLIYLVDRYGDHTIYDVDFHPLVDGPGAAGRRSGRDRPPDAQRASRPHGAVGRVLRAALQFPRDPLFRHRGPADRAALQGDDQPLTARSASRSTRAPTTSRRSPNTSRPITARASSTSRWRPATSTARSRRCASAGRHASWRCPRPITRRSTRACPAMARIWRG